MIFLWLLCRLETVVPIAHLESRLIFLFLSKIYLIMKNRFSTHSWFLKRYLFRKLFIKDSSHTVSSAWGKQMVFKISYSFIHFKSTCFTRTFFFFIWEESSFWILYGTAFLSFPVKMFHNLLLQFLLSVRFYQFYQFLLLIIRSIIGHNLPIQVSRLILITVLRN